MNQDQTRQPKRMQLRPLPPEQNSQAWGVPPQGPAYQEKPPRHKRRRRSRIGMVFTLIGVMALLLVLAKYVVIPLLVVLPQWMGGTV